MGCAPSTESSCKSGCRLMSTKLTFTKDQLDRLNSYFRKQVDDAHRNEASDERAIESRVERLVQRLLVGAADLDRRFSSMFLVSLNEPRRIKNQQLRFEYLLRIDALSTPAVSSDYHSIVTAEEDTSMPGFVRLKVQDESWQEYVDITGRLRRDLVKAKLATLLATTIKQEAPSQSDGKKCTSTPGQVVDAEVLDRILKQPDYSRVFYASANSDGSLGEPKRHRIALIEDTAGILLRIGLDGCKTREIEVRLLIGIGLSSWSNISDYPRRIPLHHCDALLHYTASQSGMYAVTGGPYTGARCENRSTLWRIRVPAAEKILREHHADDSVPGVTDSVLLEILDQLREGRPRGLPRKSKEKGRSFSAHSTGRLRVVSRHILRTIHRWSLERGGPDPLTTWAPDSLARHVLLALDELVRALRCQNLRCYFHPRCNVMLQCARAWRWWENRNKPDDQCVPKSSRLSGKFLYCRGGALHHEDSYASDGRVLESYLMALHQHSSTIERHMPEPLDVMEGQLIVKWRSVMASLPRGTMNADYGYSRKQLEYFSLLLQEVVRARDSLLQDHVDECSCLSYPEYTTSDQVENLVYLVRLLLRQARDQVYLAKDRRQRLNPFKKFHYNTISHFDQSVGSLVDLIRRDTETANMDLEREPIMAKMLLRWLYFGLEWDKKILEPILRPYLGSLFNGLHEYCYYADSWRERRDTCATEMRSLVKFCKLVSTQKLSPATGIVDFLSDGWLWSESLIRMIERSANSLRLIFSVDGRIMKYNLTFAGNKSPSTFSSWSKVRSLGNLMRKRRSNSHRYIVQDLSNNPNGVPSHVDLRNLSPLTYVASMARAHQRLRGPGDLISAMISIGKFRILQEVAAILPREQRLEMLDMIHRAAKESSRKLRRTETFSDSPKQTYTPRVESDLLDSPSRLSPDVHSVCIITERQMQLQRELQGMQDSLRSNVLPKPPSTIWDSHSLSSWTSTIDSSMGTISFRRYRVPIWDAIRGESPMRENLATKNARNKLGEMISREESPNWSTTGSRRVPENPTTKDEDRLPSWESLESALNEQLCNYRIASPEIDRITDTYFP